MHDFGRGTERAKVHDCKEMLKLSGVHTNCQLQLMHADTKYYAIYAIGAFF